MIHSRERAEKRLALEKAAQEFADAHEHDVQENAKLTEERLRVERLRVELIRTIAGCQSAHINEIAGLVAAVVSR